MIRTDQSLKAYNGFSLEATARYFAAVDNSASLRQVLASPIAQRETCLLLGGGTNVLFTRDFEGLVIHLDFRGKRVVGESSDSVWVQAQAGENWHELVCWTLRHNLGGLENLSLIPGRVGAAPLQNIGAYGVELKRVFHELEALEIATNQIRTFSLSACRFGYRDSVFKRELKGRYIILSVTFRLSKAPHILALSYGSIRDELEAQGVVHPDIQAVSRAVVALRRRKLPDPAVLGNCGSFFKNPLVSRQRFEGLKAAHSDMPSYPSGVGILKLPAAWLIERAGWKGYRRGDAGVHREQALVLVNHGQASGLALARLAHDIQTDVLEKFGVQLDSEVNLY